MTVIQLQQLAQVQRSPQDARRAFLSVCEWVNIYYLWRPHLKDEADNQS
jgi:hypothetical protein